MTPGDDEVAIRPPYPTDLTDEEWAVVEDIVEAVRIVGRKRDVDNREIVNAVLYMWRSGCTWRMLPHDFPTWTTVYYYYRRWGQDGTLGELRNQLGKLRRQPANERV